MFHQTDPWWSLRIELFADGHVPFRLIGPVSCLPVGEYSRILPSGSDDPLLTILNHAPPAEKMSGAECGVFFFYFPFGFSGRCYSFSSHGRLMTYGFALL